MSTTTISGPHTHGNLAVYFVHAPDSLDTSGYMTLEEALDRKQVVVHETGHVGELLVENLLADKDLLIIAGEIVRGGRQDRVLGVDFIVPAAGKLPIPSFCVESGRWHRRAAESAADFSSAKHYLASKGLKMAARVRRSQGAVWEGVTKAQDQLADTLQESVSSTASPSSYELTLGHEKVLAHQAEYVKALTGALADKPDVVGFVFAVNGRLNSGEVYASAALFRRYWDKHLKAAAVEALAEARRGAAAPAPPAVDDVQALFERADKGPAETRQVSGRVTLQTRRAARDVVFETHDTARAGTALHRNYLVDVE